MCMHVCVYITYTAGCCTYDCCVLIASLFVSRWGRKYPKTQSKEIPKGTATSRPTHTIIMQARMHIINIPVCVAAAILYNYIYFRDASYLQSTLCIVITCMCKCRVLEVVKLCAFRVVESGACSGGTVVGKWSEPM